MAMAGVYQVERYNAGPLANRRILRVFDSTRCSLRAVKTCTSHDPIGVDPVGSEVVI